MWKLLLVGKNYGNLSDERLEEFGKGTIRVIRFVGTRLGYGPDAKTIHKYRSALSASGLMEELFDVVLQQLAQHGFELREGTMIDGSLVRAPKQQLTQSEQEQLVAGQHPDWPPSKARQKDVEARWTKKGDQAHFGYKRSVLVSEDHKLIFHGAITPAHVHDLKQARILLEKVPKGSAVYGDRGYDAAALRAHLEATGREPKDCVSHPAERRGEHENPTPRSQSCTRQNTRPSRACLWCYPA